MSAKHAREPRLRRPMSAEQRAKLAAAQRAYVAHDPRWSAHRQKLAEAQIARRMTLFPEEIAIITALRKQGRTLSYIAEEIGIDREVLQRELQANGLSTASIRAAPRARRGKGFWRSFDDPDCMQSYLPTS